MIGWSIFEVFSYFRSLTQIARITQICILGSKKVSKFVRQIYCNGPKPNLLNFSQAYQSIFRARGSGPVPDSGWVVAVDAVAVYAVLLHDLHGEDPQLTPRAQSQGTQPSLLHIFKYIVTISSSHGQMSRSIIFLVGK